MDRPKLLIVTGSLVRGGAETHLLRLLPRLADYYAIRLFLIAEAGELYPEMVGTGIPVERPWLAARGDRRWLAFRIFRLAVVALQLILCMLRLRPQIAHFYLPQAYALAAPLALLCRVPHLIMSRRSLNDYQKASPLLAAWERRLHCHMALLLGNSAAVATQLRAEAGEAAGRVRLVYNGIPLGQRTSGRAAVCRDNLGIPPGAIIFIVVANLIPYKGHADLLHALSGVAAALPGEWRLLAVGRDDGIGEALRGKAHQLGIGGNVLWMGQRHDVLDLLQIADIAVLPSHEEGFSNAILEAMAAGLPVVATAIGGNGEAVLDGETGCLVPPRDAAALGAALLRLAREPELRARFGHTGRLRAEKEFSLDQCVAAHRALYAAVLSGSG